MNQTSFSFSPASRNTDPVTSHLAEQEVTKTGKRQTQAEIVLEAVRNYPGRTSFELTQYCPLNRYQIARRTADLETLGKIRKGPEVLRMRKTPEVTWYPK